jgi:predicted ATPase
MDAHVLRSFCTPPDCHSRLKNAILISYTLESGEMMNVKPRSKTPPGNLPTPLSSFIGREREIAEVIQLLSAHRLVTLTGAGGSGKTRLSLQVAHELQGNFKDGIWFVELGSISIPALIHQTIVSALDIREQAGRPLLDVLVDHLATRHVLLIIDNCEHLISACAQTVENILQQCPDLKILVTSREVLGITGEVAWTVPPLSLPASQPWVNPTSAQDALRLYEEAESVQLFVAHAQATSSGFELTTENGAWVAEICRQLDGMPLAIQLAAARVRTLSVQQIAQRLDDRFRLLTGGSRTAPLRQQTLAAALDWSYDLLSATEQKILQRLSVFAGGATLDAAEAGLLRMRRSHPLRYWTCYPAWWIKAW